MELHELEAKPLEVWRRRYREQLGTPVIPDFHEGLCLMGRGYECVENGHALGYAVFAEETWKKDWGSIIPEFFLNVPSIRDAKNIVAEIFRQLKPESIIGRTDDPRGFPLLMDLNLPNRVASPLYLLESAPHWRENKDYSVVESTWDDAGRLSGLYASVLPEDGGIPDEISLAKSLAAWRHYRLIATGGDIAAVAYVVPQGGRHVSVVPIVAAAYRGRGLGRYLSAFALSRELSENKIMASAVNVENEAAKQTAELLGARLAAYFVHFSVEGTPLSM